MLRTRSPLTAAALAFALTTVAACSTPSVIGTDRMPDAAAGNGDAGAGSGTGGASGTGGRAGGTSGTGGINGNGGGAGGTPAPPPPGPPECTATEPAVGATCDPTGNPDCHTGGFRCRCVCSCGSICVNVPQPCTCPPAQSTCAWSCSFTDFAGLVDVRDLAISIGCADPSAPTMTFSLDVAFRAAPDDPALSIRNIAPIVIGGDGSGADLFVCDLPTRPDTIGPIAPGAEQTASFAIGPASCTGGSQMKTLCSACGASARVSLGFEIDDGGAVQGPPGRGAYYETLGQSTTTPIGTLFPLACTH